ncbi:MAG TPA: hypothetical protein VLC47_07045 [Burkholderiales bacterium]|nr:hypothetical protein [Burkholderiales bacterium]
MDLLQDQGRLEDLRALISGCAAPRYLILDNVPPFGVAGSGGGGVAHGAHIGGFLAGFAAALAMGRKSTNEQALDE